MVDGATTNYGFVKPDKTSPMNDFTSYLNNNWDKITAIPPGRSITGALPQTGTFNIGDRIYRTNDTSTYILVCKSALWGWFWRPVHAAISPWITVPAGALTLAGWTMAPDAANPFAIALDNRGNCHWRGTLGIVSGVLAGNTSYNPFAPLPVGLRPREACMFQLGYSAFGAATNEIEGVRLNLINDNTISIRAQGLFATTSQITKVYFDGAVKYATGSGRYFTP